MKNILFIMLILIHYSAFSAEVSKVGTTAAGFLGINQGARGCGMGSAYTAIADDATGVYWNPAGLARMKNTEASYSTQNWILDLKLNFYSCSVRLKKLGTINIAGTFVNMDKILNEPLKANSKALGLSYAHELIRYVSVGVAFKYIKEEIFHSYADGYAFDGGVIGVLPFYNIRLGISFSNYGTQMQMHGRDMLYQSDVSPDFTGNNPNINSHLETGKYDLPRIVRYGIAIDILNGIGDCHFNIACDGVNAKDEDLIYNLGFEFNKQNIIFLRTGYLNIFKQYDQKPSNCYGVGFRLPLFNIIAVKFDYAHQNIGFFDDPEIYTYGLELLLK
jgi:hypothetical protein